MTYTAPRLSQMTRVARSLASIAPAAALITNPALGAQTNPEQGVDVAQIARSLLSIPLNKGVFDVEHQAHVRAIDAERHIQFDDLDLYAPQGVYKPGPRSSTRFFVDHFAAAGLDQPRPGQSLCDVGCGTGAIGLSAARRGWQVLGTDIDPGAVRAARRNAQANGLEARFRAVGGSLLAPAGDELFDVIVFNEPLYDGSDGVVPLSADGADLHQMFLDQARKQLKPGGMVLFAIANCSSMAGDLGIPERCGWQAPRVIAADFDAHTRYARVLVAARASMA